MNEELGYWVGVYPSRATTAVSGWEGNSATKPGTDRRCA